MLVLFGILMQRIFVLQIVEGEEYLNNYALKIEKERELKSTRGNIYDRDGNLLAYNELAYTITIEDNGSYDDTDEKNTSINHVLEQIFLKLDENGDSIENEFEITRNTDGSYTFNVDGKALKRFLADVYGHSSIEDLEYNKKLGYNEGEATAEQVMEYLQGEKFGIAESYEGDMAYRITVIRYAMSENSYQKYISTTIASDVSEEMVAYISENADILQGVEVTDDTIRRYVDSKYFAHIIGYTGKISQEEYEKLSQLNSEYTLTDVVGKSGIEQYMDLELQGTKGSETVYVDNLGKVVETKERIEPEAGNHVYLSIDADLTKAVYDLLEQEIAGIVYDKIRNIKNYDASAESSASDIIIPIDDVFFALIENNVLNMELFSKANASTTEKEVHQAFLAKQEAVLNGLQAELTSAAPTPFGSLDNENEDYISHIVNMLKEQEILVKDRIDTENEVYLRWADGEISLSEYLNYAIAQNWIDITQFTINDKYSDSTEVYNSLLQYIREELSSDTEFSKIVYKYMLQQNLISGTQLCILLFDQGILKYDEEQVGALTSGAVSAYNFIREKIKNLEITPAQLALDPCSGSCVVTDVASGEILALVSYPGYDNNRLANTVVAEYYASLTKDLSNPLYNYATQEKTAPGSTFKIVAATAGLAEGAVNTTEQIKDEGRFTVLEENGPKCWAYPSNHGLINISEAIRDSCNYYFYELGYRLSLNGTVYNENKGIDAIQKYAAMYGLNDTTGIEIPENSPQVADEYPITASIGQSNNNYTTTQLARYVTSVANKGTVYQQTLLKEVKNSDDQVLSSYSSSVKNQVNVLNTEQWTAIHSGMRMVVENLDIFEGFPVEVAGKTGTAQQVSNRANHALFVGFAPYNNPKISIATRIAYGYSSHNAADVSKDVLSYYFKVQSAEELITGQAKDVSGGSNTFTD
ncbi:MAG: peptidoglycan glycosyltransferase [Lachnospiraceae bacterium]|nr:peptidoglycan glycosyltransferase [Lachnospiraceae bacterium]